ncbi:right-handed parallel beta-helix repeat-containing protein [Almyronema epifaneia]|uniref:Right-handed parallel beta-helix repeat-containing protein n=1 Tax=Almyronema epifaneia S1 TaxID=2991925 RepID=A0ABW6IFG3_9CYAN
MSFYASAVCRSLSLGSLLAVTLTIAPALAQTVPQAVLLTQSSESASTTATDLRIRPRWHINYNSANGGYSDGFTGFEGFIPLQQTPGENVIYWVPRISLDDEANLAGSLLAGYRFLAGSTLLGGYAGFDFRDTGSSDFTQFAAGLEAFGDVWDIHLNAYLPIGDTRNQVSGDGDTSRTPLNPRFQGNQLIFDLGRLNQFEAALGGVDVDAGFRLLELPEGWGNLWAYSGLYYYGGNESDDSLGVRLRLDYRLQENLRFGLGVQHDDLFGTNVFFSVNTRLGSPTPLPAADDVTPERLVWARAAESLTRNQAIVVEKQTDLNFQADQVAINPSTGEAYFFVHVTPGGAAGTGTVEDPVNTLVAALSAAGSGHVVYVRPGDSLSNPLSGGFTIPGNLQVRSSGVEQSLPVEIGSELTAIVLPDFGDRGTLPRIDGGVTLIEGNNILAGFDIRNAVNGITVSGASGAIVQDNAVAQMSGTGIVVQNNADNVLVQNNILTNDRLGIAVLSGSDNAVVQNNQISQIDDFAIVLENAENSLIQQNTLFNAEFGISATNAPALLIQGNQISQIDQTAITLAAGSNQATVAQNTITNTQFGLVVSDVADVRLQENDISQVDTTAIALDTVTDGVIQNNRLFNAQQGINALTADNLLIQDNQIFNISVAPILLTSSDGALIQRNQVFDASNVGIGVFDAVDVEILDNQLSRIATLGTNNLATTRPAAIYLNQVTGTARIAGNTVIGTATGNGNPRIEGQAIAVGNISGDLNLAIANNTIGGANPSDNNAGDGIVVVIGGTATGNIAITNNQIEGNGTNSPLAGDGIQVAVEGVNNLASLTIADNLIANNVDDGIDLRVGNLLAGNPQIRALITGNTIQGHGSGQGINLQAQRNAAGGAVAGVSRADVAIESNTLSTNATDIRAVADGTAIGSTVCLRVQNNVNEDTTSLIRTNNGQFQLEPLSGNTNNMATIAANVPANTCNTP